MTKSLAHGVGLHIEDIWVWGLGLGHVRVGRSRYWSLIEGLFTFIEAV